MPVELHSSTPHDLMYLPFPTLTFAYMSSSTRSPHVLHPLNVYLTLYDLATLLPHLKNMKTYLYN